MAYSTELADRLRDHLSTTTDLPISEKRMFGGLAFMVDDKMCVNVSKDRLMCRFDPARTEEMARRLGYQPMVMRGRPYQGYCYVEPAGYISDADFDFWVQACLDYNPRARSSRT